MKRLTVLAVAILAIGLIVFSACNKLDNPTNPTTEGLVFNANIPLETEMNVPSDLSEATLDKPAMLLFPKDDPLYPERPIKYMVPIGRILKELNLTDEQIAQVQEFMQEYRDCVKNALLTLRESEKQILQQANQQRQQVREQLKNGEITKEQAWQLMQQINQNTREALMNNPVRQQVLQQLKDCWDTFINNIKSILTDEQKALFEELLAKYKNNRGGKGMGPGVRP
ncbi:MAG: Spy/CpxP family protein refolding chaperone [Candidatus Kapaibacteriota bacterium]